MDELRLIPGILLLWEHHLVPEAGTFFENVRAFRRYSQLPVYEMNVTLGVPPALREFEFTVTVFHYSLRPTGTWIRPEIDEYLKRLTRTYKIAIFQDEIYYFRERVDLLNRYAIDCLYTRHKPQHWHEIYPDAKTVKKRIFYMAGYVAPEMVEAATKAYVPLEARPIDVGYRGRRLPYYLGRAALEKSEIGEKFLALAQSSGLALDISIEEHDRHYGDSWHQFLSRCKAMLGVQGGVSVIDQQDRFRDRYYALIKERPNLTFDEFADQMGEAFTSLENRIDYRAFTPRHFEAAAFRNVQILFEGRYDGMLTPDVHYIPLCKDFSNIADVLGQLRNLERMKALSEQAWHDLIGSGRFTYEAFIRSFDKELEEAGIRLEVTDRDLDVRLQTYLADWTAFQESYFQDWRAITKGFINCPALYEHLLRARQAMEAYAAARPFYPVSGNARLDLDALQAQDRRFWRKLCRIARCDLDSGAYRPTFGDVLHHKFLDTYFFGRRAARKILRIGRSLITSRAG
ncbi:MAG TPA: hypothetical protein VFE62_27035 [Gemmataceae bacterium]|nr:hypothetical protein [Gemmataceae bacterium]